MSMNQQKKTTELIRFFLVGGMNTAFGYGLFALLLFLEFHYTLASALATIGGVLFNYQTTGKLVFNHRGDNRLLWFIGVYVILYLLNILFLAIFNNFSVNLYLAGAILILPMALLGYWLNKTWVFNSRTQG